MRRIGLSFLILEDVDDVEIEALVGCIIKLSIVLHLDASKGH